MYKFFYAIVFAAALSLLGAAATAETVAPAKSRLRLDRAKYHIGDCLLVAVTDADQNRIPGVEKVSIRIGDFFPKGASTGDSEIVTLVETGGNSGVFQNKKCVPIHTGPAVPGDGILQVNPGDVIAAAYQDPDNPKAPRTVEELDLSIDLALISGGKSKGLFQFSVDPAILPKDLAGTPGKLPAEPYRPLAMVHDPDKVPLIYGEDQIVYLPATDQDLSDFLALHKGTVVDEIDLPSPDPKQAGKMLKYFVIRIDPEQEDLGDFAYVMELSGIKGKYTFSSENSARLVALLMEEQLGGRFVTPNYLMQPLSVPVTREGDFNGDGVVGDDGFGFTWFTTNDVQLQKAMVYLDLIDRNTAGSVNTAIIDVGFAGPADYPPGDPLAGLTNPDYGLPFASITQGDCFFTSDCSGSAGGINPIPCVSAPCPWHGTQVFSIAGAVANNTSGAIGVAGHGRDGAGQDGIRGVMNPMLFKIGAPYITDVARAVNAAAARGANVINMSNGFFCTPLTGGITAGIHTNICSGADRAEIIVMCTIIATFLPAMFPELPILAQLTCPALLALFDISGVYDFDALVVALRNARNSGVVLVASGPETGGGFGPFDANRTRMVPCTLVPLCVGAIDNRRAPAAFNPFGGGIDIWAPGDSLAITPLPGSGGAISGFAGTSAAAPFITGVATLMRAANPSLTPGEIETILKDTSRALASAPASPCETKPSDPTSCVGFVDAYAAVQAAAGITLSCDGWDEAAAPVNDSAATATIIGLDSSGVTVRSGNYGIHALPGDEDWWSFQPAPMTGSSTTDVTIQLTFPTAYGLLRGQLLEDDDNDPATPPNPLPVGFLTGGSSGGVTTLTYRSFLFSDRSYFIRIFAASPAWINDNCYGSTLTIRIHGPGPAADRFETGGGNNTPDRAAVLGMNEWTHTHFDPLVVQDYAGPGSIAFSSQEAWRMSITGLSLHNRTDRDFFRIPIPDPADPANGGHDDINPDRLIVEPLPECGVIERMGFPPPVGSGTDHIIFTGVLTVAARSASLAPGESLAGFNAPNSGGPLSRDIVCPRSMAAVNEILFSFGERPDERGMAVDYELGLEYKIDIERIPGIADWILGERDARGAGAAGGMPCTDGFFPSCPTDPDGRMRFGLGHPLDSGREPGCKADGCPEFYIFNWPAAGSFDMSFSSTADLSYDLFDASRTRLGEAVPVIGDLGADQSAVPLQSVLLAGPGNQTDPLKRLYIPQLRPGLYVLVVSGLADVYTVSFMKPIVVNQPPVADAGPDQTVPAASPAGALVTLNGSGSSDPDGDPLTFTWTGFFGTASGESPAITLPVGVHIITLTVADPAGAAGTDTVRVTVKGAADQIHELVDLIKSFALKQGIENSLIAKLQNVLAALATTAAAGKADACNMLTSFIHETEAQSGKAITNEQAGRVNAAARQIRAVLGCL